MDETQLSGRDVTLEEKRPVDDGITQSLLHQQSSPLPHQVSVNGLMGVDIGVVDSPGEEREERRGNKLHGWLRNEKRSDLTE